MLYFVNYASRKGYATAVTELTLTSIKKTDLNFVPRITTPIIKTAYYVIKCVLLFVVKRGFPYRKDTLFRTACILPVVGYSYTPLLLVAAYVYYWEITQVLKKKDTHLP